MLRIIIWRLPDHNEIIGFTSSGHADYDEKGYDIVCAGSSALIQATILSLHDQLKLELNIKTNPAEAFISCFILNMEERVLETKAILNTMLIGLMEIAKLYPYNMEIIEKGILPRIDIQNARVHTILRRYLRQAFGWKFRWSYLGKRFLRWARSIMRRCKKC